ncbi:hypothetical protein KIPB_006758, partial [Kipferlia bialata]
ALAMKNHTAQQSMLRRLAREAEGEGEGESELTEGSDTEEERGGERAYTYDAALYLRLSSLRHSMRFFVGELFSHCTTILSQCWDTCLSSVASAPNLDIAAHQHQMHIVKLMRGLLLVPSVPKGAEGTERERERESSQKERDTYLQFQTLVYSALSLITRYRQLFAEYSDQIEGLTSMSSTSTTQGEGGYGAYARQPSSLFHARERARDRQREREESGVVRVSFAQAIEELDLTTQWGDVVEKVAKCLGDASRLDMRDAPGYSQGKLEFLALRMRGIADKVVRE